MAGDRGVAGNRDFEVGEVDRLHRRLSGHHAVDELGLVLDPAVRVAVAQLLGAQPLQLGFIGLQQCLSQRFDILLDRRFFAGFGERRRAEEEARYAERQGADGGQVATGYMHEFLPRVCVNARFSFRT